MNTQKSAREVPCELVDETPEVKKSKFEPIEDYQDKIFDIFEFD